MRNKLPIYLLSVFILVVIGITVQGQQTIKILSYNVLYGLQKDSVKNVERYKQLINELQPDMVATQEMNGWTQKTLEELAKSYGHPYALQSKETGFPVALTSKTPLVNFKKVTENMWHSYIYAKVRDIHVFVIHFSPFSYQKRLEEVANIIAQAAELPANEPILIMGDFNALAASDSGHYGETLLQSMRTREENYVHIHNLNNGQIDYSVLNTLEKAGFYDSYKLLNKTFTGSLPTYKDGNGKIKQTNSVIPRRIDYMWCNAAAAKRLKVSTILKNALTHYISDHYPVYIELAVE